MDITPLMCVGSVLADMALVDRSGVQGILNGDADGMLTSAEVCQGTYLYQVVWKNRHKISDE